MTPTQYSCRGSAQVILGLDRGLLHPSEKGGQSEQFRVAAKRKLSRGYVWVAVGDQAELLMMRYSASIGGPACRKCAPRETSPKAVISAGRTSTNASAQHLFRRDRNRVTRVTAAAKQCPLGLTLLCSSLGVVLATVVDACFRILCEASQERSMTLSICFCRSGTSIDQHILSYVDLRTVEILGSQM